MNTKVTIVEQMHTNKFKAKVGYKYLGLFATVDLAQEAVDKVLDLDPVVEPGKDPDIGFKPTPKPSKPDPTKPLPPVDPTPPPEPETKPLKPQTKPKPTDKPTPKQVEKKCDTE